MRLRGPLIFHLIPCLVGEFSHDTLVSAPSSLLLLSTLNRSIPVWCLHDKSCYCIYVYWSLNSFLCFKKELEQSWWSPLLHAVYHFNLTAHESTEKHKIEIELVKSVGRIPSQSGCVQKEPNQSIIVIKG